MNVRHNAQCIENTPSLQYISMCSMYIVEICLNCSNLYSMHHSFTFCLTIYLVNWMGPYSSKWPPPMQMLVANVRN